MRKGRKGYPTLLELMRRGRQAAVASSSALALWTAGCPLEPESRTAGKVPLDVPADALPDGIGPFDPGPPSPDLPGTGDFPMPDVADVPPPDPGEDVILGGVPPMDVPMAEDTGPAVPDPGGLQLPEPTADVPSATDAGQDVPLAGGIPMPEPDVVQDAAASEDAEVTPPQDLVAGGLGLPPPAKEDVPAQPGN